jgi:hypothetical protein
MADFLGKLIDTTITALIVSQDSLANPEVPRRKNFSKNRK